MKATHLPAKMLALLVLLAGAMLILAYYYTTAGGKLPLAGDRYAVTVLMDQPQQLLKHADVRSAGVKVGEVADIQNRRGNLAAVRLELKDDVVPIYRDATVLVRQKTLVGENYVDLQRGQPRAGEVRDGSQLPITHAREAVPIDTVLNSLDAKTRRHIRNDLRALGDGFDGRGSDFNELMADLPQTFEQGNAVMSVLESQREQVADVVAQTGTVMQAIASRSNDLRTLVGSAKTTAEAVASRDDALRASFDRFPATLAQARGSVSKLSGFSRRATPVASDVRVAMSALDPVMKDLRPTAVAGRRLFAELPATLKAANPMLDELKTFSTKAKPSVAGLEAALREANPALDYLKPYTRDIGAFFSNFGGNSWTDKWGQMGPCACPVSDRSLALWNPEMRKAVSALLDEGLVSKVMHMSNNGMRKPNRQPYADEPFTGEYPRIGADTSTSGLGK